MRGHVCKRSKNSWTVVVELPRDPVTNKRRQKWVTIIGTKKEAEKELARLINELETGFYTKPSKTTLSEYLTMWLEITKGKVRETTWNEYQQRVNRWKSTEIAAIPLQKITPMDIELTLQNMKQDFNLNPARVKVLYVTAKEAFKKALLLNLISTNPFDAVDPPKVIQKEMKVWTKEEAAIFLKAIANHKYYALFYLALKSGARLGELMALQWKDIDFEKNKIQIKCTAAYLPEGKFILQQPKTNSANRTIPVNDSVIDVLKKHKKNNTEKALKLGFGYVPWVFWSKKTGRPPHVTGIGKAFAMLIKKAKVPAIRFHDLRHTHATFLLEASVHPKIVAERLGHSSIQITMDRYSHVLPNTQKEAVKAIEGIGF